MISLGIDTEDRPSITSIQFYSVKTQVWLFILIFIVCLDQLA